MTICTGILPLHDGHDVLPPRPTISPFICMYFYTSFCICWSSFASLLYYAYLVYVIGYWKALHHTWPLLFWPGTLPSYIGASERPQRHLLVCLCMHNYLKWKTYMHPLVSNQWRSKHQYSPKTYIVRFKFCCTNNILLKYSKINITKLLLDKSGFYVWNILNKHIENNCDQSFKLVGYLQHTIQNVT